MQRLLNLVWVPLVLVATTLDTRAQPFISGIDVSHWQGNINWTQVKNSGIEFAFTKATEGVNFVDSKYHANVAGANAAGVLVGMYHFARPDSYNGNPFSPYSGGPFLPGSDHYLDVVSEANDFIDAISPYYNTGTYLPPVLDLETEPDFGNTSLEYEFTSHWAQLFSDTVNDALGLRPLVYTSLHRANNKYEPEFAAKHDLWLAWWKGIGTSDPPVPSDTPNWTNWKFWQWTASSSVPGISGNVDGNVFDGTMAELEQLLIGGPYSPPATPFENMNMLTDFEVDEGYFNWSTSYSGSNQGILGGSSATRSTEHAHQGDASQKIVIDGEPGGWFLRHLSGIGSPPSRPASNEWLKSEGYLGFWLKTTDPGITVQFAIDDPAKTSDRGLAKPVIADGKWHLYEWDLSDDAEWEAWTSLADGIVGGAVFTLDSIQFSGAGDATIYLDSVAHNPDGSLLPESGDFDYDGDVDGDDLAMWEIGHGISSGASITDGDADGDTDSDALDFLTWQRNHTGSASVVTAVSAVPEPTTFGLLGMALAGFVTLARTRLNLPIR